MNSKSLVNCFPETIKIFEKFARKPNIFAIPQEFHHRFMYIAPSSGHSLLNPNVPFKLILRLKLFSDARGENAALF